MEKGFNIIAVIVIGIFCLYLGYLLGISVQINTSSNSFNYFAYNKSKTIEFPIVAVSSTGEGVLEKAILRMTPGSGRLLMEISPFVEPDTQYSFETAIKVASKLANVDYKKYDFILEIESNATLVGGPSAGAAMSLAVYCLLKGKDFPKGIAITGTINPDGTIGQVGGVFEKALAAARAGKKLFFVPKGQSIIYRYEKIEKRREIAPGFVIIHIEYKPVPLNLSEYFESEFGMKIIEVASLKDIVYSLQKYGIDC